jgi:hypothetical protein
MRTIISIEACEAIEKLALIQSFSAQNRYAITFKQWSGQCFELRHIKKTSMQR